MISLDLKHFVKKGMIFFLLFLAGWILYFMVELFLLPIDFFNFRVWEAIKVEYLGKFLSGPFYPRLRLVRYEEGDLGHGTLKAISRKVEWQTDEYGYRNSQAMSDLYDIVIVGDSFAAGGGLTQGDMLSEAIRLKLSKNVYTFAPANINEFLLDERFNKNPPSCVVFCISERDIPFLPDISADLPSEKYFDRVLKTLRRRNDFQTVMIDLDRFLKFSGWHYIYNKIHIRSVAQLGKPAIRGPLLFLEGELSRNDASGAEISTIEKKICEYQAALLRRNIHFIFLAVPNKESVYFDCLKNMKEPKYLTKIIKGLKKRKVNALDLQTEFLKASRITGSFLYQVDDTHWNRDGVRLAADLIVRQIESSLKTRKKNEK
jgi:alginate O-acetyltransferase complex protein AlgJ